MFMPKISGYVLMALIATLPPLVQADESPSKQLGLSTHKGRVLLEGQAYQGIGVNYFNLFSRSLKEAEDASGQLGLARLARAGIPFVRFMACGFWPSDWDLYLQDPNDYFARLDKIIQAAERHCIGLIPSLFWNMATVPDIVGEPMDCLGLRQSKTLAFMREYTREVVTRYRGSPAIWAWEFGNEYNLHVDLPNAAKHRPPIHPRLKTALKRSVRDELSAQAMLTALDAFAHTVRQVDAHRLLVTGHSLPRPSAFHNSTEGTWQRDSLNQFETVLLRDNPDPFDVLSVHVYPRAKGEYPAHAGNPVELISRLQTMARRSKKPLFIGEFGVPRQADRDRERQQFGELLAAIETNKVPLSALWVFDLSMQNKDWNVTFENDRAYMLELVGQANRRMQKNTLNIPKGEHIDAIQRRAG